MSSDGYTTWDRLPVNYPTLYAGGAGASPADCALRCVARIEPYERALRVLRDKGPADSASKGHLRGLSTDYTARCRNWTLPRDTRHLTASGVLAITLVAVTGPFTLWGAARVSLTLAPLQGWPVLLLTAPLLIPVGVLLVMKAVQTASPTVSPSHALQSRACPDCHTDLADATPGIDPDLLDGVNIGPHRCPRCHRPWPLLPPPADTPGPRPFQD